MLRVPGVRRWICKRRLAGRTTGTELLVSTVRSTAHVLDHYWNRGVTVPPSLFVRMEVLFDEIAHRGIDLNESLLWALQMYAIGKMRLQENYLKPLHADAGEPREAGAPGKIAAEADIVDCIKHRRSVRRWIDKEVAPEEVRKLIDIAKWAPSSCNLQPWKILVLTKPEDKQFLVRYYGSAHNRFWASAPVVLVVLANLAVYSHRETPYVQLDSGAFIQNLLLLFHANGLAACWIGFIAWDNFGNCRVPESERAEFYSHFGLSQDYLPTSLIPVGFSDVSPHPPARDSVDQIIITALNTSEADLPRRDSNGAGPGQPKQR
jgi:nitroreductase